MPELPDAFKGLEGKIFVRRHAETFDEAQRDDVLFGVEDVDDLVTRIREQKSPPAKKK